MFDLTPTPAILTAAQAESLAALAAELDRLNHAVRGAVEAGLSVEMQRAERYHCGRGNWGDVMRPVVVKAG